MNEYFDLGLRMAVATAFMYFSVRYLVSVMDPTGKDKKKAKEQAETLMKQLKLKSSVKVIAKFLNSESNYFKFDSYELMIAQHLVIPSQNGITWDQIGGCVDIIHELLETVILPMKLSAAIPVLNPPKGTF